MGVLALGSMRRSDTTTWRMGPATASEIVSAAQAAQASPLDSGSNSHSSARPYPRTGACHPKHAENDGLQARLEHRPRLAQDGRVIGHWVAGDRGVSEWLLTGTALRRRTP